MHRAPTVNLIAGPQTYHNISDMVAKAENGKRVVETDFEIEEKFARLTTPTKQQTIARGVAAFLTVQEGCDKFCTFCVVPYTRGAEVSRSVDQIVEEAYRLVEAGVREVTLLGQNVNAWHGTKDGKKWGLGDLLYRLSEIEGLWRLRYTTSHPIDMDDTLIEAHGKIEKLMPYLHLPVQAGSDKILKAMNRHHTKEQYIDVINRVRKERADMAISGDFIVGFPGESDADFEDTMQLIKEVGYTSTYSFKYSERPGTPGAELEDKIPEEVKAERLLRLQALLREQLIDFNASCVGKEMDVLLEKKGRDSGQLVGRSPWLQAVVVNGDVSEIGQMISVKTKSSNAAALMADRI
ncbi:MAG: tRNA (N6-isopentenyl adenosine(37)-C2)-methylthiotransferase MiaB, partial [Nitratireductor sp.]